MAEGSGSRERSGIGSPERPFLPTEWILRAAELGEFAGSAQVRNFMLCARNRRVAYLYRYIHILTYTLGPLPSLTWVGETEKVTRAEPGPLGLGLSSQVSQPPTCRTPPQFAGRRKGCAQSAAPAECTSTRASSSHQ